MLCSKVKSTWPLGGCPLFTVQIIQYSHLEVSWEMGLLCSSREWNKTNLMEFKHRIWQNFWQLFLYYHLLSLLQVWREGEIEYNIVSRTKKKTNYLCDDFSFRETEYLALSLWKCLKISWTAWILLSNSLQIEHLFHHSWKIGFSTKFGWRNNAPETNLLMA